VWPGDSLSQKAPLTSFCFPHCLMHGTWRSLYLNQVQAMVAKQFGDGDPKDVTVPALPQTGDPVAQW
jgi:hypothetical protein